MKRKLSALLITVFLITSTFGTAFAADGEDIKKTAGITPDSILYPVERVIEDIQQALTFDNVKGALLLTEIAEERLAEAQVMIEQNKIELAQKAAEDYTKTIEEANSTTQEAADETNKEDSTATGTTATTDKEAVNNENTSQTPAEEEKQDEKNVVLEELLEKNIEIQKKSIDVLAALLDKLPEEARQSVTAVIVKQIMHAEAVKDFVQTKKTYNDGRKDLREAVKMLDNAKKSGDAPKIEEAQKALDEVKGKLADIKDEMDKAVEAKKDIKTAIANKLAELNLGKEETEEVPEETEIQDVEEVEDKDSQEKVIKEDIEKVIERVKKELKEQYKEEHKEQIKEKVEQHKEEIKEKKEEKKEEVKESVEQNKESSKPEQKNEGSRGKGNKK